MKIFEFVVKHLFNATVETIILSAITAILFSGGTNFILQKINRKGNLLTEKGFLIISRVIEIDTARIEVLTKISFLKIQDDEKLRDLYSGYAKKYREFDKFIKVHSFLLNKDCMIEMDLFLKYLSEPLNGMVALMENKDAIIGHNNKLRSNLSNEIIKLIQKQMI